MASHLQIRKQLDAARRVVVKIGSRTLVQRNGRPDTRRMAALVADIAELRKAGREVVVAVSYTHLDVYKRQALSLVQTLRL